MLRKNNISLVLNFHLAMLSEKPDLYMQKLEKVSKQDPKIQAVRLLTFA
jgi:hypothetical protein